MRRAGAAALAIAAAACAPSARVLPVPGEPWLRVGIVVDQASGDVTAMGQFRVLDSAGGVLAVVDPGVAWKAQPGDGPNQLQLVRPDRPQPDLVTAPITVRADDPAALVVIGGHRYHGEATILRGSTGVTVVNRVPLEAYVQSVTVMELGLRDPAVREAVEAQAVAARTYALRYLGRRQALGFDLFATVADQVYPGTEVERPEVTAATQVTRGQILTWQGRPIEALYHSTCGWSTEAADQVFRNGQVVPYLRAVSDRYGPGDSDYYCRGSPYFRWRVTWSGADLNAVLAQTLPAALGSQAGTLGHVTDLRVAKTTPTGRVAELDVATTSGDFKVPAWQVRDVLRPAPDRQLLSTLFQLYVQKQGGGGGAEVVSVIAAGAGSGHGVGMCQWGAVGRARAGQSYVQILATYYPGTNLEQAY